MANGKNSTAPLTLEAVKKHVRYCPETGLIIRLTNSGRRKAGEACGCISGNGYIRTSVLGVELFAHRLAWFLMTGGYPRKSEDIDHINRNKLDNRWRNLRLVSRSLNMQNTDHYKGRARGVSWCKRTQSWQAGIKLNYKRIFLGRFKSHDDAVRAYQVARSRLHLGYVDPSSLRE
jgi:hypothetical protein